MFLVAGSRLGRGEGIVRTGSGFRDRLFIEQCGDPASLRSPFLAAPGTPPRTDRQQLSPFRPFTEHALLIFSWMGSMFWDLDPVHPVHPYE